MTRQGSEPVDLHRDFETWARISAQLQRRSPIACSRVVRDAGVAPQLWATADAHWYEVLATDVDTGRLDRPLRYRALCAAELEARAGSGEAVSSPVDALRTADDEGATSSATPSFAKRFAPAGVAPKAPEPKQEGTRTDMRIIVDQEMTAEQALSWPPERYAWVCAQLERYASRGDHIWAAVGIFSPAARAVVRKSWERRFEQDSAARTQHEQLLRDYLQGPPASGPR